MNNNKISMKIILFLFAFIPTLCITTSCESEDTNVKEKEIVGKWYMYSSAGLETLIFKKAGKGYAELNNFQLGKFSYFVKDSTLYLTAKSGVLGEITDSDLNTTPVILEIISLTKTKLVLYDKEHKETTMLYNSEKEAKDNPILIEEQ